MFSSEKIKSRNEILVFHYKGWHFQKQTNKKKRFRQVHCEDLAKWIDSIVRFDSWQLGWDILCAELLSIFLGRDQIV